jgi:alkylation response protein AidB-like acyl-CoA dehydrogenase
MSITSLPGTYELPAIKHAFELTEDQRMVQEMVRDFARAEVAPIAAEIDEHHRFPTETWRRIVELGLPGIPFAEDVGGSNGGTLAYCLAVEEISRVCGSTGLTLAAHVSLGTYPIYAWGGALRERYVPRLVSGEYMGAYGLTEPNAGSDSGGTLTTAEPDGGDWVLNGRKCFCTNANHAGTFIVTAVTDKELGPKGISAFVVPREAAGFSIE